MRNKIVYSKWTFNDDTIKSGSISVHTAVNPLSNLLEADTFTAVVKTTDKSIANFTKNTPLRYYHRDVQRFLAYIQAVDREGPNEYRLTGTSAVGLLMDRLHKGGVYTGQTAQALIQSICGSIPFTLKASFKTVPLYGWLPYAKPPERSARDNLCQVLFALGCSVRCDANGTLIIEPLSNTVAGSVGQGSIFSGASVKYGAPVSAVTVVEHQYMQGGEETTLFDGMASAGDIITFSEPMYGLKATGFSIRESNANYAVVSGGTGTLTGRAYIHNTRQITKAVTAGAVENIKTISDATLISVVNSEAAADRMAAYYRCLETIQCGIVLGTQIAGNMLNIYHPYNKNTVKSCVESIDVSASGILRGDVKALVGYTRPQNTILLDQHMVVTASKTVTLPDGVTHLRAVLIGGGTGGAGGKKGQDGKAGTSCSSSGSKLSTGAPGEGGTGGDGGVGGAGGKIASFDITGAAIKTLTVSVGAGGAGGAINEGAGSAGGNTTLTVNGTTYSSATGSPSGSGFQDVTTGTIYGSSGGEGHTGGKGGTGGFAKGDDETDPNLWGKKGEDVFEWQPSGFNLLLEGGAGGKYQRGGIYNKTVIYRCGGGGGGAAIRNSGGAANIYNGGAGAAGSKPDAPKTPGTGGTGGNGGGGGGGGGGTLAFGLGTNSASATGGAAGSGGNGSQGGDGAPGCVILYYGVKTVID